MRQGASTGSTGPLLLSRSGPVRPFAIHIEAIDIEPPFESPNGGPFFEGMGAPVPLTYREGAFLYPNGVSLRARPSVGNVAVLPAPTQAVLAMAQRDLGPARPGHRGWGWRGVVNDTRGRHCHQDCRSLTAGATIHMLAQTDEVGLCRGDVHGYIGEGELAFAGIEVAARVQLRVERSEGWTVDWPLIVTPDEVMVFCSDTNAWDGTTDQQYVDVVRRAYQEMRKVVAARMGCSISEANAVVAAALDIRNCALYGLAKLRSEGRQMCQFRRSRYRRGWCVTQIDLRGG